MNVKAWIIGGVVAGTLCGAVALAQQLVSPIVVTTCPAGQFVNGITANGSVTCATPPIGAVGNNTTAYTTDGRFVQYSSNTPDNSGLYVLPQYSAIEARLDVPAGSSVQNASGVASYVRNFTPSLGETGNAVAFTGMISAGVNNAQTWGLNTANNQPSGTLTGQFFTGYEADFNTSSPDTKLRGVSLYGVGYSAFTSDERDGFIVGSLSVNNPGLSRWLRGFVCDEASITLQRVCLDIQPELLSGNNVGGPSVSYWYRDASGAKHYYSQHAHSDGHFYFDSDVHGTNRYIFAMGARLVSTVEMPGLSTGGGPGVLVCVNNTTGLLYKATAGAC